MRDAGKSLEDASDIAEVAHVKLSCIERNLRIVGDSAQGFYGLRIKQLIRRHGRDPAPDQIAHDALPDESGSAGYQEFHAVHLCRIDSREPATTPATPNVALRGGLRLHSWSRRTFESEGNSRI
jgi:hypothetical protein